MFSQLNHQDSINYFNHLKVDSLFGNRLKDKIIQDFVIKNEDGKLFTNENLRSKITVINFWFEACAPCVAEFQALEKFYNKNKSREGFQFISITYEQDSVIERVQKKYNFTYPVYHLCYDSCQKLILRSGFPTNLIVNKNLKIVFSTSGGPINPDVADKNINHFIQAELDKQLEKPD